MPAIGRQESSFEPAPSGLHPAVCCALIDQGTQERTYGNDTKIGHYYTIMWELLIDEKQPGGEAFTARKDWLNSASDKSNMQKDLAAWRGRKLTKEETEAEFNLNTLVGAKCMLNITQAPSADGTRIYANIASISPLMKGLTLPKATLPAKLFIMDDTEPENFREDVLDSLHEKLRALVKSSPEYECIKSGKKLATLKAKKAKTAAPAAKVTEELNDEIPF